MTCVHLKKLYQLCEQYQLKLSSSELVRITCPQCGLQETCPSAHFKETDGAAGNADSGEQATPRSEPID